MYDRGEQNFEKQTRARVSTDHNIIVLYYNIHLYYIHRIKCDVSSRKSRFYIIYYISIT